MSTTTPSSQPGLAAFNSQNPFDPYLPATSDDEQLTQVSTSQNTPGSHTSYHTDPHQTAWLDADSHRYLDAGSASGVGDSPYSEYTSNGMSPSYHQDFQSLEGYEVQGFENNLLLADIYGDLPAPENPPEIPFFQPNSEPQQEVPISATTTVPQDISRQSTGLANLSEHLMSPQLTDMASPESVNDATGSFHKSRLPSGSAMSRVTSQGTAVNYSQPYAETYAQRTPATNGSSVGVSPDPSTSKHHVSAQAPSFLVELHTRGDSPARTAGLKRNRGGSRSSFLAAPETGSSEDSEHDDEYGDRSRPRVVEHSQNERSGMDPATRDQIKDDYTMSPEDMAKLNELKARNSQIGQWILTSDEGGPPLDETSAPVGARKYQKPASRRRAKSSANTHELPAEAFGFKQGLRADIDARTPGPGLLLDEESEDEDDDDDENEARSAIESAPASIDLNDEKGEEHDSFPFFEASEPQPQDAYPWIDPIYFPSQEGTVGQPGTSNAAMTRFLRRAKDIETASRSATWGTTARRMSDGDMQRVFGTGGLFSRLSVNRDKQKDGDRDNWKANLKESVEHATAKFLPKRSNSTTKRKPGEATRPPSRDVQSAEQTRKDSGGSHERHGSLGSQSFVSRVTSVTRPKSPRINTNTSGINAAIANATQIGSLGVHGPKSPSSVTSPTSTWENIKQATRERLSRHSSQDAPEYSLIDIRHQTAQASFTSPTSPPIETSLAPPPPPLNDEEDAESEEVPDEKGISMTITPSHDRIIPNRDGFKVNVRDVNPRLPNFLVERLGQEQLRRYKKLIKSKVDHAKARELHNCESGGYCADRGGQPKYFPARAAQKEKVPSHTGFTTAGTGEDDEDTESIADGLVTEAQFPPGLPMPPAKRLPAEFECPLCFTVKKFYKPSDWSKHVHEDLQPFTCTFSNCPDPKSFKRKADWVRHENERHRQLEWWQCTEDNCTHQCFRRDNFVQHLVREHKLPEPKAKNCKPNRPAVRGPAKSKVKAPKGNVNDVALEDKVLYMVEVCRKETTKNAIDEPCRFCGNVCNSFKKLTVHLARHMETLSLPILELVKQKDVTPDTIVSPIENKLPPGSVSPAGQTHFPMDAIANSPYNHSEVGGFSAVATSAGFAPSQYQTDTQWSQANSHGAVPGYGGGMDGSWIPSNPVYPSAPTPQFAMHHNSVPNPAIYNMSTQSHGLSNAYGGDQTYETPMGQRPHFSSPQYVAQPGGHAGHNVPASQGQQGAMAGMQFESSSGVAYSEVPSDAPLYGAQVGQQPRQPQGQGQPDQQYYQYGA